MRRPVKKLLALSSVTRKSPHLAAHASGPTEAKHEYRCTEYAYRCAEYAWKYDAESTFRGIDDSAEQTHTAASWQRGQLDVLESNFRLSTAVKL